MDKIEDNIAPPDKSGKSTTFGKLLHIVAYPIAAISGIWAANASVHNHAYDMAKKLGAFDDLLAKATPKSKCDAHELLAGKITTDEYVARSAKIKETWQVEGLKRMEELGLNSFSRKWKYMARAARQETILTSLTAAGIAIGALLTIADSKNVLEENSPPKSRKM